MIRNQGLMRLSRTALPWLAGLLVVGVLAALAAGGGTTRVSVSTGGAQGNAWSSQARVSADGRYVAFVSAASNLVAGDTNGKQDIFVRDRTTGVTTRVNVSTGGAQANWESEAPSISADGRYVAFTSNASNLVAGDTNTDADTFVRDRTTGVTTRVSVSSSGVQAVACVYGSEDITALSADGRYVAFRSDAGNLVAEDTNEHGDIFVHDRTTGLISRVSVATGGIEAYWGGSNPTLSADGRYVSFRASANSLGGGGANVAGMFIHDRATGHTGLLKTDVGATVGVYGNEQPTISADGRYVAFFSWDSTVAAGDTNGTGDVFLYDRSNGQTTCLSVAANGASGNNLSDRPSISADGRYVSFSSYATNLVTGDTNKAGDIFVRDRKTGTTTRVSSATDGTQGTHDAMYPALSGDGRYVAFESESTNLTPGDTNGVRDIFTHDCGPAVPTVTAWSPTSTAASAELPTLTATFSAAMDKATAQNAFSISPAQAAGVQHGWPGTFSWVGNKLVYKLSTSLAKTRTYTVTIAKSAKSSAGVAMAADKTWTFKTNAQPAVLSYAPTGTAVPRSTTGKLIKIAFNQPMNKASVEGALWVNRKGAAPSATPTRPPGVFSWVGNELRYTCTNKLSALTEYTVKVGTGAKSSTGVARTAVFTWIFKTGGTATVPGAVTVASAPTAAGAQITVNLSAAAAVTVTVRNLAGREVAVLQPGELGAGAQTLLWNGKSRTGTKVPAGMYLLQVRANLADGRVTQAMTSLQLR